MRSYLRDIIKEALARLPIVNTQFDSIAFLSFHDIDQKYYPWFLDLLSRLDREFGLLDPRLLDPSKRAKLKNKSGLFVSFDDGFFSSYELAREVKARFGVTSLLFLSEGFINLNEKQASAFLNTKLFLPSKNNMKASSVRVMRDQQIRSLISEGHVIGCHTKNHKMLSTIKFDEELRDEIVLSKSRLEKKFDICVSFFAYPFGGPEALSLKALELVAKNYNLGFVNVRGRHDNFFLMSSSPVVFRNNVMVGEPYHFVKAAVQGKFDILSIFKLKKIQRMLSSTSNLSL